VNDGIETVGMFAFACQPLEPNAIGQEQISIIRREISVPVIEILAIVAIAMVYLPAP
jgi:hypothetical protein